MTADNITRKLKDMSAAQKLLLLFLSFFISLFLFVNPTLAQTSTLTDINPQAWGPGDQAVFSGENIANWFSCWGTALPFNEESCPVTIFDSTGPVLKQAFNGEGGGALGTTTRFMAAMYNNKPASGVQYVAMGVSNTFGLEPPPAYAQVTGSGANVIAPVLKLWQLARNIAYLGFVIIFVTAGILIMFRYKLNPQTVISIQNALPGLVVGLILVTFSYFISGLIIDLAFLGSQFIGVLIMSQLGNAPDALTATNNILNNMNFIQIFTGFIFSIDLWSGASTIGNDLNNIVFAGTYGPVTRGLIGALAACLNPIGLTAITAATAVGGPIGGGAAVVSCVAIGYGTASLAGGTIISALIYLVLLIGLLQAMIRLMFSLIGAYVTIVITTILGPFIILISAVPGNGKALSAWWKPLLANVLIFPAVFGLFLLVAAILNFGDPWFLTTNSVGQFNQALPLFGGSPVSFISVIIAYGLLLAAPAIPDFVKDSLGAKTNQLFMGSISKNLGTGSKGAGLIAGAGTTMLYGGALGALHRVPRMAGAPRDSFLGAWSAKLGEKLGAGTRGK